MIVSDVAARVKRQFGDESGVQVTDADIVRWINDAQRDIGQAQEIIETIATQTSVAGQQAYNLPTDIINLRAVYYNSVKLEPISLQQFDTYINEVGDPANPESGTPTLVYIWANDLNFYPIPDVTGDTIKLYYSQFPADVVNLSDPLSLPIKYDNRIVEYCLQQAYELDENFDAANLKGAQFSNSLSQMREDSSWTEHTHYPMISIHPEDM